MLYVLILASITLILGIFQLFSAIRNRGSIIWGLLLVIVPLIFVFISAQSVIKTAHENNQSVANTSLSTKKSASLRDNKLEDISKASKSSSSQAQKALDVKKNLAKSFKTFGTLTYDADTKTYHVSPTDKDTKKVFKQLISNPDQVENSNFNDIEDKFVEVSKTLKKDLGSGYALELDQPDQTNKAMLIIKDGKTTYNMFS